MLSLSFQISFLSTYSVVNASDSEFFFGLGFSVFHCLIEFEIDELIKLEEENADTIKLIIAAPDTLKDELKEFKLDEDE